MLQQFEDFLGPRHLTLERVIHVHADKGRVVAIVRDDAGLRRLMKWNVPGGVHAAKLRLEAEFYQQHRGRRYIPEFLSCSENHLEIEYVDGTTLRQWLIDFRRAPDRLALKDVLAQYSAALSDLSRVNPSSGANMAEIKPLTGAINRLMTSGPMDTVPVAFHARLVAFYRRRFVSRASKRIRRVLSTARALGQQVEMHGDLHLNNMLVDGTGRLVIVDWENRAPGPLVCDALYSAAMIYELLRGSPQDVAIFDGILSTLHLSNDVGPATAFPDLADLFRTAIAVNPRFHYQSSTLSLLRAHARAVRVAFGLG